MRVGDLAAAKAVSLAPAPQKARLKTELAALRKSPTGAAGGQTLTATTNGKTYTVKPGPNGTFTGTDPRRRRRHRRRNKAVRPGRAWTRRLQGGAGGPCSDRIGL